MSYPQQPGRPPGYSPPGQVPAPPPTGDVWDSLTPQQKAWYRRQTQQPGYSANGYDPYGQQLHPPSPTVRYVEAPREKRRVWPWVVGGVIALFIVGSALGGTGSAPSSSTAGTSVGVATSPGVADAAEAPAAPPAAAGPSTTFADGTYEVGVDVAPGKYKTQADGFCYWDRTKRMTAPWGISFSRASATEHRS